MVRGVLVGFAVPPGSERVHEFAVELDLDHVAVLGRASTTGCPTVVRTMGVRGGKRKNGEGQNPSPFR